MNDSHMIRKEACPACKSRGDDYDSDNLVVYSDGHTHCFACSYHTNGDSIISEFDEHTAEAEPEKIDTTKLISLPRKKQPLIENRSIGSDAVNKFLVSINTAEDSDIEAVFPRFDADGNHIANQIRYRDKKFTCEGLINKATPFGRNVFPAGGKTITITEGYYDTLASFELTGGKYPTVGVMSASTAKKEIVGDFEYLNSFESVILNFDSDEPGQKAAKECAILFAPGKVRILTLSKHKDANDYLKEGLYKEYVNEWWRAPSFMPDGLKLGTDANLLDEIINYKEPESVPYPWEGLNKKLYGMRLGEFTLFMADTGIGKTTFMKEIEYALLQNDDLKARGYGVGFLHLEEPKRETLLGMLSIHNSKPYHLPDTPKTSEEITVAYNEVLNNGRVVVYDHFGSNDIDVILNKIRHMAALGCRYIVLDHLSIIVSDQSGDERKQLDEISTKLKTLTMNLNICVISVIHINRKGEARGSAGPEQVANNVVRLVRDKKEVNEWRRNITAMEVEKCRLSGRTGPAAYIHYDAETHRLRQLSPELSAEYASGSTSAAGSEFEQYA